MRVRMATVGGEKHLVPGCVATSSPKTGDTKFLEMRYTNAIDPGCLQLVVVATT